MGQEPAMCSSSSTSQCEQNTTQQQIQQHDCMGAKKQLAVVQLLRPPSQYPTGRPERPQKLQRTSYNGAFRGDPKAQEHAARKCEKIAEAIRLKQEKIQKMARIKQEIAKMK